MLLPQRVCTCSCFSLTFSLYHFIPFIPLIPTHPSGLSLIMVEMANIYLQLLWAGHCSELLHLFNLLNPYISLIEKCQDYHYLHFIDKEKFSNTPKVTQLLCSRTKTETSTVRSGPLFLATNLQSPEHQLSCHFVHDTFSNCLNLCACPPLSL